MNREWYQKQLYTTTRWLEIRRNLDITKTLSHCVWQLHQLPNTIIRGHRIIRYKQCGVSTPFVNCPCMKSYPFPNARVMPFCNFSYLQLQLLLGIPNFHLQYPQRHVSYFSLLCYVQNIDTLAENPW